MKLKLSPVKSSSATPARPNAKGLLTDVRELILSARQSVATTANATLTMLHWQIGNRIRKDILRLKRAESGEQIFSTLSKQLEAEFGRGFGERNLSRMVRFAEVFPDPKILTSLMSKLGWTHFLHLIRLDDPLKRDFYAEMCRIERWSTRTSGFRRNGPPRGERAGVRWVIPHSTLSVPHLIWPSAATAISTPSPGCARSRFTAQARLIRISGRSFSSSPPNSAATPDARSSLSRLGHIRGGQVSLSPLQIDPQNLPHL